MKERPNKTTKASHEFVQINIILQREILQRVKNDSFFYMQDKQHLRYRVFFNIFHLIKSRCREVYKMESPNCKLQNKRFQHLKIHLKLRTFYRSK